MPQPPAHILGQPLLPPSQFSAQLWLRSAIDAAASVFVSLTHAHAVEDQGASLGHGMGAHRLVVFPHAVNEHSKASKNLMLLPKSNARATNAAVMLRVLGRLTGSVF